MRNLIELLFDKELEGISAMLSDDDWHSMVAIYLFSEPTQQYVNDAVSKIQVEFPELVLDGTYSIDVKIPYAVETS
jgi:hypothetical protein